MQKVKVKADVNVNGIIREIHFIGKIRADLYSVEKETIIVLVAINGTEFLGLFESIQDDYCLLKGTQTGKMGKVRMTSIDYFFEEIKDDTKIIIKPCP